MKKADLLEEVMDGNAANSTTTVKWYGKSFAYSHT